MGALMGEPRGFPDLAEEQDFVGRPRVFSDPNPAISGSRRSPVREGTKVDIFSNSRRTWCRGVVDSVQGDIVAVLYTLSNSSEVLRKELHKDHPDLRIVH